MKLFRPTVYFTYHPKFIGGGGTTMRGKQLSTIARKYLKGKFRVKYTSIDKNIKNSIIYLTKMAALASSLDRLAVLKRNNNILIFDPIDERIDDDRIAYADAIVAASYVAFDNYKKRYKNKNVFLVHHHVDPRIKPIPGDKNMFNIGYFGELQNTHLTNDIESMVDVIHVDTSSQDNINWIHEIPGYSMHYAVRKNVHFNDFKPATKIFTAAHCGANVIIQSTEEEAVRWLGHDYPYLIHSDSYDERLIIDTIKKAKDGFGGAEWKKGLRVMERIKQETSQDVIGGQVRSAIESLAA